MSQLYFNSSIFRILVFSDLHYGESATLDYKNDLFQTNMITMEKPDFIVFNGDMSSDYAATGDKWVWWTTQWSKYTSIVRQQQIPYALNIGNHDVVAGDAMTLWTYDMIYGQPYSFTTPDSVQSIPIYLNDEPVYYLWLISSGKNIVQPQDVQRWSSNNIRGQMFVHIPLPEILALTHRTGIKNEFTGCYSPNTGLAMKVLQDQHVDCVWHGHDHLNNHYGYVLWGSLKQCFGNARKSGYGGYTGLTPGATVIDVLNYGQDWTSHVRLYDGQSIYLSGYTSYFWVWFQISCDISLQSTIILFALLIIVLVIIMYCVFKPANTNNKYTPINNHEMRYRSRVLRI